MQSRADFLRPCWRRFAVPSFALALLLGASGGVLAQEAARTVAATVDGRPIYVENVEQAVERIVGQQPISAEGRQRLAGQMLDLLIQRRLALAWLEASSLGASDDDIALAMARLERALSEQERTLEDFLAESSLTQDELRERYAWEIGWGRFLERQITEKNLEAYFDHHSRQFDGTELRVAQVLLSPAVAAGKAGYGEALAATLAQAEELREQIAAGELTFAEAAEQHSTAPSATEGGEQGWIRRHEPMPESFSVAAFELEAGEISPPVETVFGVHLILCQEVKPGQRTWQESREALVPAVEQYLLSYAADRQRPNSVVEYTGELPYGGASE